MSKLLDILTKQAAALNMKGDKLRNWVFEREVLAKAEESERITDEKAERKRQDEIEERRRQDAERKRPEKIEEKKRQDAIEEKKRQDERQDAEKKRQDELELHKFKMEFEYKMVQAKIESDRRLSEDTTSNANRHTPEENRSTIGLHSQIRCPTLCPSKDDCDLWFLRFQELCVLTGLEERYWATKGTEFFDPETLKWLNRRE